MAKRIKGNMWNLEEEEALWSYVHTKGPKWKEISELEPLKKKGRTVPQCKTKFSRMKKKVIEEGVEPFNKGNLKKISQFHEFRTGSTNVSLFRQTNYFREQSKELTEPIIVPFNRRNEFEDYLGLFGYNKERSILIIYNVHFKPSDKTFVIVGITYDPTIKKIMTPFDENPTGYMGLITKNQDKYPHQLLPLDFTPVFLSYPKGWKGNFKSSGFFVGLQIPSRFLQKKEELEKKIKELRDIDVSEPWLWLQEVNQFGFKFQDQRNEKEIQNCSIKSPMQSEILPMF